MKMNVTRELTTNNSLCYNKNKIRDNLIILTTYRRLQK